MEQPPQGEVGRLLRSVTDRDPAAAERLLPVVYDELRRMAQAYLGGEVPGHTLSATALVHEAYVRLAGRAGTLPAERAEFFAVAAQAMRRILVDHARAKKAQKRGGSSARVPLDDAVAWFEERALDLPELDRALVELAGHDPRKARLVELRFFAGMSVTQVAEVLAMPVRTVERDWTLARAWLRRALRGTSGEPIP
ncbi:MAG: sigma-70 family RNA polymerase sigma factor [Phycisphaerales bacterium]